MAFFKRNIWLLGFAIVLIVALFTIWVARETSTISTEESEPQELADISVTLQDHIKGSFSGKLVLIEWSDFQCPACRSYYPLLNRLLELYPNDLKIAYKHFPLTSIHLGAVPSARAAEAAALQSKFWEMHNKLFDAQESWSRAPSRSVFEKIAVELNLDIDQFRKDYDSESVNSRVELDLEQAIKLGLNSTPTFYLNGKKIKNPLTMEEFQTILDSELQRLTERN